MTSRIEFTMLDGSKKVIETGSDLDDDDGFLSCDDDGFFRIKTTNEDGYTTKVEAVNKDKVVSYVEFIESVPEQVDEAESKPKRKGIFG